MFKSKYILALLLIGSIFSGHAQDSLKVTIPEADKLFLQKNLLYAANQLNVEAQKALEIQAKLYPNPTFSFGFDVYDGQNQKGFNAGGDGEKTFDFEQLILLGGKRKNQIKLSAANTKGSEIELENLIRNLKFELHKDLYSLYFDLGTLNKYNIQLQQLDTIINSYEVQANKGNIPLKEVVRLKSVYIRLNNDKTDLLLGIQQEQKDLQVLLHTRQYISPVVSAPDTKYQQLPAIDSLQNMALRLRNDLQLSVLNESIADLNIKYQKSLSVPDLNVGTSYDQAGGAFRHQYLLTLGVPIPLWNRNQGNIKYAQTQKKAASLNTQIEQSTIENEVAAAWANMNRSIQEYQKVTSVYNTDFGDVYRGMQFNFLKRNISIIEFVDYFESYNETVAEVNRITKQLMLSAENINYTVAYPVY